MAAPYAKREKLQEEKTEVSSALKEKGEKAVSTKKKRRKNREGTSERVTVCWYQLGKSSPFFASIPSPVVDFSLGALSFEEKKEGDVEV